MYAVAARALQPPSGMDPLRNKGLVSSLAIAAAALAGAGCESAYVYQPTEHATAQLADSGLPAARYDIPVGNPQGVVTVGTLGVHHLENTIGRHVAVRMIVRDNSDAPWSVDVQQQRVRFANGVVAAPAYVYGVDAGSSVTTIPARGERSFDLLFPVPADLKVVDYQLLWSVATPQQLVTERTPFRREAIDYGPAYAYYDGLYGAPYWYGYSAVPWIGPGVVVGPGYYPSHHYYYGRAVPHGRRVYHVPPPTPRHY